MGSDQIHLFQDFLSGYFSFALFFWPLVIWSNLIAVVANL
jgi:hypothetical protein